MVRAYVMIQTEVGQTGRVAREVAEMQGIASAVPVAGPHDVIAIVEAANMDALGKMVVSRIQSVKGSHPYPDLFGRAHLRRENGQARSSKRSAGYVWRRGVS